MLDRYLQMLVVPINFFTKSFQHWRPDGSLGIQEVTRRVEAAIIRFRETGIGLAIFVYVCAECVQVEPTASRRGPKRCPRKG